MAVAEEPEDHQQVRGGQRPDRVEPEPPAGDREPRPDEKPAPAGQPKDDDPWAKYVRAFIKKYQLNDEQQQRAWLVYRDARERNAIFERRFERRMKPLRLKAGQSDDEQVQTALRAQSEIHQREVERLFNQLKRRLERLPTRAQRKNAEPDQIEVSESPAKAKAATSKP